MDPSVGEISSKTPLTVDNVDFVDPTTLVGARLMRYHHLKRYKQMMRRADEARIKGVQDEKERRRRELEQEKESRRQLETAEGVRRARKAMDEKGITASVMLAYNQGGPALSKDIYARWSSGWRQEQLKLNQAKRQRSKMTFLQRQANRRRQEESIEERTEKRLAAAAEQRAMQQARQRLIKSKNEARRKAREQFLKHKPGNKFAVWELQTRLASDRNGGWTPTPTHLNKELELAYVRERSVHKFTTNGQMCIANFKAMEVENTISQRFTPLRRRLRNQKRLETQKRQHAENETTEDGGGSTLASRLPHLLRLQSARRPASASPLVTFSSSLVKSFETSALDQKEEIRTKTAIVEWEAFVGKKWIRYPARVARIIERQYQKKTAINNTVNIFYSSARTKGNTLGFVITFDEPMQEMCSSTGEVVPVQRREPVRPAAMIKSCYPTFEKKHKDLKLQLLPVSDRWAAGHFNSLHEAVYAACLEGDQVALRKMHATGEVDINHQRELDGRGFLHAIAYASSESVWEKRYYADMSKLLVQWKADLELRDGHDQTALFIGATNGNETVVAALLEVKANPSAVKNFPAGPSALMMAAVKGFRGVVQFLLNAKAEVDYAPTVDKQQISVVGGKQGPRGLNRKKSYGPATTGATALWIAARAGQLQSVKELIAAKADISRRTAAGRSALQIAEHGGHVAVARCLVQAGADDSKDVVTGNVSSDILDVVDLSADMGNLTIT